MGGLVCRVGEGSDFKSDRRGEGRGAVVEVVAAVRLIVGQKGGLEFVGGIDGELPSTHQAARAARCLSQELGIELWHGKHQPHLGEAPATGAPIWTHFPFSALWTLLQFNTL